MIKGNYVNMGFLVHFYNTLTHVHQCLLHEIQNHKNIVNCLTD